MFAKHCVRRSVPVIFAACLGACVTFRSQPIDPSRTEALFRERTLADPGLRAYLETRQLTSSEWPPRELDLQALILIGFYFHPDLEIARARVARAEAGIVTAAGRPNPSIDLGAGYSDAPESPWLYGLSFDVPIETAGKRSDRIVHARHLTEAARLQLAEAGWQVRSRVRAALVTHLLARRNLHALRAEARTRAETVALMEQRLAAGEVSQPDVELAGIELDRTRLAIHAVEGAVAESRAELAAALGLPLAALADAHFVWRDLEAPPAEETLSPATLQRAGLLNRLDIRRALAEYAAAEAALQLEVAKQYPDVHLGPGYHFDDAQSKFTVGLAVTLPILNQNQGPIGEAEAARRETAARFLALQAQVIADTEQVLARYRAALAELAAAQHLVAGLDAHLRATEHALQAGETDRLAQAGIRVERAVAARARVDALRKTQATLGALEDVVQRPLGTEAAVPDVAEQARRPQEEQGR